MRCTHCGRELAAVAVIFEGKPPVCGRADCLAWARALMGSHERSAQAEPALRPAA